MPKDGKVLSEYLTVVWRTKIVNEVDEVEQFQFLKFLPIPLALGGTSEA
jgi:hypothetical protein